MIAAFGDDTTAMLMFDTRTIPVPSGPGAECLTVTDGKIVYNRFIFDRVPFAATRPSEARTADGQTADAAQEEALTRLTRTTDAP